LNNPEERLALANCHISSERFGSLIRRHPVRSIVSYKIARGDDGF
jgi:hypothetical protein